MKVRMLAIGLTFYVMGFGDARGSLVGIARETFGISASQGSLIPAAGALAFGLFSVPAGLLATRAGKNRVIEFGLLLTAAGHALPILFLENFNHLLLAQFTIGCGMTCLLVAGNPLLREVTEPARFPRNLTFAQSIKSLGSVSGPYFLAAIVALGYSWQGLFPALALFSLLTCVVVAGARIPETIPMAPATLGGTLGLLRLGGVPWRILGIFLFVGTEMGLNTWIATHLWRNHGLSIQVDAIRYGQGLFWVAEGIGRLLGALALTWLDPRRFFLFCTAAGLAGLLALAFGPRPLAIAGVALCGLTFANIWPTLFALLVNSRPQRAAELAGLAVMANLGGAVLPGLMGVIVDLSGVRWSFLVPLVCFAYLGVLAVFQRRLGPDPQPEAVP
jgi:fucose permease